MLVLSRKQSQSIRIGDEIEVTICEIRDGRVRIGIQCPREIPIVRRELIAGSVLGQKPTRSEGSRPMVELALNGSN